MKKRTTICSLAVIAAAFSLTGVTTQAAEQPELQWPWWRGPFGNGMGIGSGQTLNAKPKVKWIGNEYCKTTSGGGYAVGSMTGGCQSLVMHNNRIYVSYFIGAEYPVSIDKDTEKTHRDNGRPEIWFERISQFASGKLSRFGYDKDDKDTLIRMALNVYADDVMVCLDAATGKTLWKTVVPGGLNGARATCGGHMTPGVDPTTGRVYAYGSSGRVLCFDGETGELLWQNESGGQAAKDMVTLNMGAASRRCPGVGGRYEIAVAIDGVVAVGDRGLDGATGREKWRQGGHWLWVPWKHEGKWYLIKNGARCVDPVTGEELWQLGRWAGAFATGKATELCVDGDRMFVKNRCYRISPTKGGRTLLWENFRIKPWSMQGILIRGDVGFVHGLHPESMDQALGKVTDGDPAKLRAAYKKANSRKLGLMTFQVSDGKLLKTWPASHVDAGGQLAGMDNRVFWRPKNHSVIFVDPENDASLEPYVGKEDGVGVPMSQTPPLYKGLMFLRASYTVACLDYRPESTPVFETPPQPDAACAGLTGDLKALGSPFKAEREAAIGALSKLGKDAPVVELLDLLVKANYLTAEAAAKALSLLPSPLPQAVLTETQEQQVAAYGGRRLGVVLHGLFAANPKAGTALAAKLLEDAAASNAEGRIESLANALRYPPLHRDAALAQTVVPQLTACCKQADPYAIGSLCAVLKRLPADLVAPAAAIAMGKVDTAKAPHHVVEAALQACSSGMVSEAAKALTAYAGGLMSDYRKNREYGAFIMGRCPRELAIAELRSIYTPKSFGSPKSKAFFFKALKNMHGDAGKKLAAELAEPKAAGGQQGD